METIKNKKEEKIFAINLILYAINIKIISTTKSIIANLFGIGLKSLILNPLTNQYHNVMHTILNYLTIMYMALVLFFSTAKNKILRVIGFIMTAILILIIPLLSLAIFIFFGFETLTTYIPYLITSFIPMLIWGITQLIYIIKEK